MLSIELSRIADRLRSNIVGVGRALSRHIAEVPNDLRKLTENFVTVDHDAARLVDRTEMPQLIGVNAVTGTPVVFTADRVRSLPIRSVDGEVVGVNFPVKLSDSKKPLTITPGGLDAVSNRYFTATQRRLWPPKELLTRKPKWAFSYDDVRPAPWGTGNENADLVLARAHAGKTGYFVQVKSRIPFTS